MPDRKTRDARRNRHSVVYPSRRCPNCGETHNGPGHFIPPSLGEPGRFMCRPYASSLTPAANPG